MYSKTEVRLVIRPSADTPNTINLFILYVLQSMCLQSSPKHIIHVYIATRVLNGYN